MRTIRPALLLPGLLILASLSATAQTYFYIHSIAVEPAQPTNMDVITIALNGDLSSTGSSISDASWELAGNTVHITLTATNDIGMDILVPHTEEFVIGTLPTGTYNILVDGAFIDDSAPIPQHVFEVSGEGPDCSVLTVESIRWSSFTDTAIVVHLTSTEIGFSYPGFVLLSDQGDTLAVETPDLFAIGMESTHILRVHPDATFPTGPFNATLHLWTGFFSELACTWPVTVNLCPAQECVMVNPYLQNTGGAIAIGTFTWTIRNGADIIATGQFELTDLQQMDQVSICLAPGNYSMSVLPDQEPTGGQLSFGLFDEWHMAGPVTYLASVPPGDAPFSILESCSSVGNGIGTVQAEPEFIVTSTADGLLVSTPTGNRLGQVRLYDSRGTLVESGTGMGDRILLTPSSSGVHLVQARGYIQRVAFIAP